MKKVGRHAFQDTSVRRISIEKNEIYLSKKSLYSGPLNNLSIFLS